MKELFSLQSKQLKAAYAFYKEEEDNGFAPKQIAQDLASFLISTYSLPESAASSTTQKLLEQFTDPLFPSRFLESDNPSAVITSLDYSLFQEKVASDPSASPLLKSLLLSFIIYYRQNPHPSGWIKYDKKTIFYLASATKIPVSEQNTLTKHLHTLYNIDMQVIGSNQPIPCYSISWLRDQPLPGSTDNPFITLGPLSPSTIQTVISIKKEDY